MSHNIAVWVVSCQDSVYYYYFSRNGWEGEPSSKNKDINCFSKKKKFLPRSLEISSNNNSNEPLKREKGQENTSSILLIRVLLRNISHNG